MDDQDDIKCPPVLKLNYLFSCLTNKAKMAVMGLDIEGASYLAIKNLKSEFGNDRAVRKSLYNELQYLKLPSESDEDLSRFVDH